LYTLFNTSFDLQRRVVEAYPFIAAPAVTMALYKVYPCRAGRHRH
jgi:hypothetical protein